ncbi:hypothetical protein K466DRAFT_19170 [Polyporus arcularius HHB13444]|uniref:Uncharacterized protein n=1 Tax=Polyporus arcularius HHB13444 TaxID=1314778 RepID=A0A5C3PJS2_9APHY|nr:hypothetical protein K466DRAFT_19170 [Polyporus arcularius HHB13444]
MSFSMFCLRVSSPSLARHRSLTRPPSPSRFTLRPSPACNAALPAASPSGKNQRGHLVLGSRTLCPLVHESSRGSMPILCDKTHSDDSGHRRIIRFRLSASTDTCSMSIYTELKCRPTRDAHRTLSRLTHDAEHGTLTHDDPPILATSDQASKAAIRQSRCRESSSSLRVLGAQLQPADMYHSVQVGTGPGSILSRLPIMTSSALLSPMHINLIVRVMLRRIHRVASSVGSPEMYTYTLLVELTTLTTVAIGHSSEKSTPVSSSGGGGARVPSQSGTRLPHMASRRRRGAPLRRIAIAPEQRRCQYSGGGWRRGSCAASSTMYSVSYINDRGYRAEVRFSNVLTS